MSKFPDDLAMKIRKLFALAVFSQAHRNELKRVCDDLLEKGLIGVESYVELLNEIPGPYDLTQLDVFNTSYLIIRKLPSKGLALVNCPIHGWEMDILGNARDVDEYCSGDFPNGEKKEPERDVGNGDN